jgi:hypothetical protein
VGLEQRYEKADAAERAIGANIRRTIAQFLRLHPELHCCEENERILFKAMAESDELSPTSLPSWEILYAENRDKLVEAPTVRKQSVRRAVSVPSLTRAEVEGWSAKKLQAEIESSPRRASEIDAALARR